MGQISFWHLKALGYCNRQMRIWCKSNKYSWRVLCSIGIDSEKLLSMDNTSMAHNAVDFARSTGWSKVPIPFDEIKKEQVL